MPPLRFCLSSLLFVLLAACGGPGGEGSACTSDDDCAEDLRCKASECAPLPSIELQPVDACNGSGADLATSFAVEILSAATPEATPESWTVTASSPVLDAIPDFNDAIVSVSGTDNSGAVISGAAVGGVDLSLEPKYLPIAIAAPGSFLRTTDVGDSLACTTMSAQRWGHSATLLDDGRVWLAGGVQPNKDGTTTWWQTSEYFDPVTGLYEPGPELEAPRRGHTATLLDDGRLFIAGGLALVDDDDNPATPDVQTTLRVAILYDLDSGEIDETIELQVQRAFHSATLLDDGTVLLAGGLFNDFAIGSTEIFVPAVSVTRYGPALMSPRAHHAALHLGGTDVALIGGDRGLAVGRVEFILADAGPSGTTYQGPDLATPRGYVAAAWVPEHQTIVVAGGFADHVESPELGVGSDVVELITVDSAEFSASSVCAAGLQLSSARGAPIGAAVPGGLVVAGGVGAASEIHADADLITVDGACSATVAATTTTMAGPRAAGVGLVLLGGDVLISGGLDTEGGLYALDADEVFLSPR